MGTFIADRIVVYGQGGHDLIQLNSGIATDAWLFGGAGNDILVGGAGDDILVGSAGEDILYGFGGRDLVFGGLDRDFVHGGGWSGAPVTGASDSDIVIGSYVSFDFDPALLNQLSRQWGTSETYSSRVSAIRAGSPLLPALAPNVTVFDDFSVDHVLGSGDLDWLFVETARDIFDLQQGESVN
jgi:Ca2+-binding RTX toxin-like protein